MAFVDLAIPLLQAGILVVLAVAVWRREVAAVVNALASIAATLVPRFLEATSGLAVPPEVTLWIAVAGLLHAIGMLGPYDTVAWWDYVTHAVSAGFVAAVVYGGLVVVLGPGAVATAAVATVLATLVVGVVWELVELVARAVAERFDVPPVLVVYSWRDTVVDLGVNGLAAVVVVLLEVRLFVAVFEQLAGVEWLFVAGTWLVVAAGLSLVVAVVALDGLPELERG